MWLTPTLPCRSLPDGRQDGTSEFDDAEAGAVQTDGSVFVVGSTYGHWVNKTTTGDSDFAGVMLSAEGEELWRWQASRPERGPDPTERASGRVGPGQAPRSGARRRRWHLQRVARCFLQERARATNRSKLFVESGSAH